jgi:hypothetical protein
VKPPSPLFYAASWNSAVVRNAMQAPVATATNRIMVTTAGLHMRLALLPQLDRLDHHLTLANQIAFGRRFFGDGQRGQPL